MKGRSNRGHNAHWSSAVLLPLLALAGCAHPPFSADRPPASEPPPTGIFRDVAAHAGLNFPSGNPDRVHLNLRDTLGFGGAFFDYDRDGHLDILLVGKDRVALYRNMRAESRGARVESRMSPHTLNTERPTPVFEDVTARAFPDAPPRPYLHGCAVADYDNDGWPDIFITGYGRTILYHNEYGSVRVRKDERKKPSTPVHSYSHTPTRFFRDVTSGSGLEARGPYDWTTSAAWADVDGDGRLDLYVCRYVEFTPASRQLCSYGSNIEMACGPQEYPAQKGSLYHNEGGGRFRDITREAGLGDANGKALGALFCDFNNDGWPDLYVANDKMPGDLFLNLGKGRFRNVGVESGTAYGSNGMTQAGMGLDWGDYDNDGRFDLLVATFEAEPKSLYHNQGRGLFTENSYWSGIGAAALRTLAFGASFVDVDNDGLLDIVFTNGHVLSEIEKVDPDTSYPQPTQLFRNLGGGRFRDASAEAGPDFLRKIVGRGIAVGDYDGDGWRDLLIVDAEGQPLLLHNEGARIQNSGPKNGDRTPNAASNHWISLRCLRAPNGPDAVGVHVTLVAGGRRYVGEARAGGSYLSTNAPEVHFGLGAAATVERIEMRWPDGRKSVFHNLTADRAYHISPLGIAPR